MYDVCPGRAHRERHRGQMEYCGPVPGISRACVRETPDTISMGEENKKQCSAIPGWTPNCVDSSQMYRAKKEASDSSDWFGNVTETSYQVLYKVELEPPTSDFDFLLHPGCHFESFNLCYADIHPLHEWFRLIPRGHFAASHQYYPLQFRRKYRLPRLRSGSVRLPPSKLLSRQRKVWFHLFTSDLWRTSTATYTHDIDGSFSYQFLEATLFPAYWSYANGSFTDVAVDIRVAQAYPKISGNMLKMIQGPQ